MKHVLSAALLGLAATAGHAQCPAPKDTAAREAPLYDMLRDAPDPATAQALNNGLWSIWTEAPDARAQDLLDAGMERRGAYDYAAAQDRFDALIAYCPDYVEGWNQRAFVRFLRQDFAGALADLDHVLAQNPDHIGALSGKALTLMSMGRVELAQDVLRAAVALNPWLPERGLLVQPKGEEI